MGLMEINDQINQILDKEEDTFAAYITSVCLANVPAFGHGHFSDEELLQIAQDLLSCAKSDRVTTDYLQEHNFVERVISTVLRMHRYPEEQISETARITLVHYFEDSIQEQIEISKVESPDWQEPSLPETDAHVIPFAEILANIPYNTDDIAFCESIGVTYDFEQLHMVRWFSSQITLGQGAYRRSKPNPSARAAYNHLRSANSLLWICIVLGADRDMIRRVAEETRKKRQSTQSCGIVRKLIPFDILLPLAQNWYNELFPIEGES